MRPYVVRAPAWLNRTRRVLPSAREERLDKGPTLVTEVNPGTQIDSFISLACGTTRAKHARGGKSVYDTWA
jgi:hypothetical protein